MDKTDFNSYLLENEEKKEIKKTSLYGIYKNNIDNATNILNEILNKSEDNEILKHIFEAKTKRLESRKQTRREKEEDLLIDATYLLNKAFVLIKSDEFKGDVGNDIYYKSHWAKVLLYNEMAICYSGLAESSISLGYAERSISLLKKLHPKLDFSERDELQRMKLLYTFSLYNKGEAERLLNNYDESKTTFNKIVKIYKHKSWKREKPSDFYSALVKIAMIFIDMGRGKEALEFLDKLTGLGTDDFRIHESELERARALTDMKKYEEALDILENYLEKRWNNTFIQRKARVNELRILIEFRRNRSVDFNKPSDDISKKIKTKYEKFNEKAEFLLIKSVERNDGDIFKKTCKNYADYFLGENEWEKGLCCYCLFLFNKIIFEKHEYTKEEAKEIISKWIINKVISLDNLIQEYWEKVKFIDIIRKIDDEYYLKNFFKTYVSLYINEKVTSAIYNVKSIIENLKECLVELYTEKDNFIELGKVKELYSLFEVIIKKNNVKNKNKDIIKFINNSFFKGVLYSNENRHGVALHADSILTIMQQNTNNFANKVVGKSIRFPKDGKLRGIFTVLRRWNSFTPTLASVVNPSKGGGYFLYLSYNDESLGVVIDPGYNFLENLFFSGFRIRDINAVIISHAHPDHTDNLPPILSLFHEANSRLGEYYFENKYGKKEFNKNQLKLILSQGVFDQYYSGFIKPSQNSLEDVIVLKSESKNPCYNYVFKDGSSLEIDSFPTLHRDISEKWESLGFLFNIKRKGELIRKIGYTSDAHWSSEFCNNFIECNIICAHLGSIVDILGGKGFCHICEYAKKSGCNHINECKEQRYTRGKTNTKKLLEQTQIQNHLYLSGLSLFFDKLLPKNKDDKRKLELAIISEFGEELKGGIRMDLYHKFDNWFQDRSNGHIRCIPGDIGCEINIFDSDILCCCCQQFKSRNYITPIPFGKEEAIFFVCNECRSVLSNFQINERLKDYYEKGRLLELLDEERKLS